MNTRDNITEILAYSLQKAIDKKKFENNDFPGIKIEYPKEEKFGDYATPFALETAKILRKSPIQIGNELKEFIEESEMVEKVEVVRPGYINIFLSLEYLFKTLKTVLEQKETYGLVSEKNIKKINLEFVSANPTGPLNVVSARAAALGDTISNLLEATGNKVHKEYYINDYGNQVYLLGKSVYCRYKEILGMKTEFPEDGYHGEYIKDIARYIKENFKMDLDNLKDEEDIISFISDKAVQYNVNKQKQDLEKFNVNFNIWFNEKKLHENNDVISTLKFLEEKDLIFLEDGKKIFNSTQFGDDKNRVVLRDDGRPTYFLSDIAYHKNKIDRCYDQIINIWGPDHHGYINRLKGAVKALGYTGDFKILVAQQVNLIMQGDAVKMSKRLGKFSTMHELLEEIGVDAARFFFIMRSMDSHLDFDLELAKKESSENPVFYLQYAHARICSIFREAMNRNILYSPGKIDMNILNNREAIYLLKLISKFTEEIFDAAQTLEPHRISTYLLKFAQAFHKFYTEHRVLSDDEIQTNTNLALCDGVRIVLKNGLKLLGVSAPDKM